ncbi:MAG: hypothetical protein LUE92_18120, partial [Clostridiales bacterium]|nr:hypothetical protein [Clostridiales bacterium]
MKKSYKPTKNILTRHFFSVNILTNFAPFALLFFTFLHKVIYKNMFLYYFLYLFQSKITVILNIFHKATEVPDTLSFINRCAHIFHRPDSRQTISRPVHTV